MCRLRIVAGGSCQACGKHVRNAFDASEGADAQGPAEHLAIAQYDSESSGGCKTPPIIEQQHQQQLQWGARNGGGTPAKMAESAAGSPVRGIRTASTSSAEETAMVLGGATGSNEWTTETLLQQCRCGLLTCWCGCCALPPIVLPFASLTAWLVGSCTVVPAARGYWTCWNTT